MRPGVMRNLMSPPEDIVHKLPALLNDEARHKEGRRYAISLKQVENSRRADLPAIASLGKHNRAFGVLRVSGSPHRLGIEIEAQHHRQAARGHWHDRSPQTKR